MTNKDLKNLNRRELLQMLLAQAEENEQLKVKLDEANQKLAERKLVMERAGSLAEASLKISGVFEAAQQAAQSYVDGVRDLLVRRQQECEQMVAEKEKQANETVAEADAYAARVRAQADAYLKDAQKKAR